MKKNTKGLLVALALPLGIGFLSNLLAGNAGEVYASLTLPSFAPPDWVFAPVWAALYLMIGLASWLVWRSPENAGQRTNALTFYTVGLLLNFLWSPMFFRWGLYLPAFWELCSLLVISLVTTALFAMQDKRTLWLMLPYDIWLLYAAVLNRAIAALNP